MAGRRRHGGLNWPMTSPQPDRLDPRFEQEQCYRVPTTNMYLGLAYPLNNKSVG